MTSTRFAEQVEDIDDAMRSLRRIAAVQKRRSFGHGRAIFQRRCLILYIQSIALPAMTTEQRTEPGTEQNLARIRCSSFDAEPVVPSPSRAC